MTAPAWGWQESAACHGADLALFFGADGERRPERALRERHAKRICIGCPVRAECLSYAISAGEKDGLWGGLNEDERAAERRRRARRQNPGPLPAVALDDEPEAEAEDARLGRCGICGYVFGLTPKGVLRGHRNKATGELCPGRGEPPLPAVGQTVEAVAS